MRLKIRCDEESLKILGFWVEVNKTLVIINKILVNLIIS